MASRFLFLSVPNSKNRGKTNLHIRGFFLPWHLAFLSCLLVACFVVSQICLCGVMCKAILPSAAVMAFHKARGPEKEPCFEPQSGKSQQHTQKGNDQDPPSSFTQDQPQKRTHALSSTNLHLVNSSSSSSSVLLVPFLIRSSSVQRA